MVTRQGILSIASQLIWGGQGLITFAIAGRFLPQKEFGFVVICNAILFAGQCLLLGPTTNPTLRLGAISKTSLNATYSIYGVVTVIVCSVFIFFGKELGRIFFFDQDFFNLIRYLSIPFSTVCLFSVVRLVFIAGMRYRIVLLMDVLLAGGNIGCLLFFYINRMLSSAIFFYIARSIGAILGLIPAMAIYYFQVKRKSISERSEGQFHYGQYFDHSKYSFICMIGAYTQSQVDALAVAYFLDPLSVAVYGAAKTFYAGIAMVTQGLIMVVLPGTSKIVASGNGRIGNYYREALFLAYLILLPATAVLMLFPGFFLQVIFGGRYPGAVPVVRILCLGALIMPVSSISDAIANGAGWFRVACVAALTGALVSIFASLNLIRIWGVLGVALAPVLGLLGSSLVLVPAVCRRLFGLGNLRTS